jgi:HAD superfamily hydrolase (TIGR01509 family)
MSKNFQYLLFDWDGCLANTPPIWLKAYHEVFAEYGHNPSQEEIIKKAFGDWNAPTNFGIQDKEGFITKLLSKVNSFLPTVDLNLHVKDSLFNLYKKNKSMIIVTSSKKEYVEPALKHHGIDHIFHSVLDMADVAHHKPDPEVIYKALEKLNGNKDEAVIIGDTEKDILAGENAGISSILYFPPSNEKIYPSDFILSLKPTFFVQDFKEIIEFIS